MEINATNKGQNFKITPSGNHVARCYSMIHIGTIASEYMGEKKELNKVRITWELPTELNVFDEQKGEQPFAISKEFTLSMHEKSTLRKFLESWRGKAFTEDESKKFDISKLLGVPCMINIIHRISETTGNKYADISSVSSLPKGFQCPDAINNTIIFSILEPDWDIFNLLPDFLKEKIKLSKEYRDSQAHEIDTPSEHLEENENDPLPF